MEELNQAVKSFISHFTFFSRDVLHVYGGALFIMIWLLLFKNRKKTLALILITAMAIVNEILDLSYYFNVNQTYNWIESLSDITNTVLPPLTIIIFLKLYNKVPQQKVY